MSWRGFLYRRLSKLVTCELRLAGGGMVALKNKYELASFQDAIVHPFYWQMFSVLKTPPRLVVDCGANCGHFTMLANLCSRVLFNESAGHYALFEANPYLRPMIEQTLADIAITDRSTIVNAFVGSDQVSETLWIHPKNFLVSSNSATSGANPIVVPVCTCCAKIPEGDIDILKIDIEGGEYGLMEREPELFERARMLFIEIHQAEEAKQKWFYTRLSEVGFDAVGPKVEHCGQALVFFKKR